MNRPYRQNFAGDLCSVVHGLRFLIEYVKSRERENE